MSWSDNFNGGEMRNILLAGVPRPLVDSLEKFKGEETLPSDIRFIYGFQYKQSMKLLASAQGVLVDLQLRFWVERSASQNPEPYGLLIYHQAITRKIPVILIWDGVEESKRTFANEYCRMHLSSDAFLCSLNNGGHEGRHRKIYLKLLDMMSRSQVSISAAGT